MSSLTAPPDGNQNRAAYLNSVAWTEVSVSTVFVAFRVYSRSRITRNLWWDDWFMILTWGTLFPLIKSFPDTKPFVGHSIGHTVSMLYRVSFTSRLLSHRVIQNRDADSIVCSTASKTTNEDFADQFSHSSSTLCPQSPGQYLGTSTAADTFTTSPQSKEFEHPK